MNCYYSKFSKVLNQIFLFLYAMVTHTQATDNGENKRNYCRELPNKTDFVFQRIKLLQTRYLQSSLWLLFLFISFGCSCQIYYRICFYSWIYLLKLVAFFFFFVLPFSISNCSVPWVFQHSLITLGHIIFGMRVSFRKFSVISSCQNRREY